MTLKKKSNVQEIRGRFENWNNVEGQCKDRSITSPGNPPELQDIPEARNRSFSVFSRGTDFESNNQLARNNSFHQRKSPRRKSPFVEKQKLVESIVANIKCSNNEKQKDKGYKTVLNSLFDKEIRSLAGVQRRGNNNHKNPVKAAKLDGSYAKNQMRVVENGNYNKIQYNNYKETEAINNFQSEDSDSNHTKSIYDNVTDKYINNLNLDEASDNQKLVVKHQLNSFAVSPKHLTYVSPQEPLRPPRRRVIRQKCTSPFPTTVSSDNASIYSQVYLSNPNQFTASSHHNLSAFEKDSLAKLDPTNERRNSAGDLSPFKQNKEPFPKYHRDPFNHSYSIPENSFSRDELSQGEDLQEEFASGPPPKKPPRTFAHDIYRQGKQMKKSKIDLEALYAKPIKKSKRDANKALNVDRSIDTGASFNNGRNPKPPIAPKPHTLNYKRYSVIEPIETPARNGNNFTTVKRNSSFRFSFRKPSTSTPMANKQIARLKDAVRNFYFKRDQGGRVKRISKSVEHININKSRQETDDHIYATPYHNNSNPTEKRQELHYLCSPLFPMDLEEEPEEEESAQQKAKIDWGGLKKEFRQSCRMVQKRIKGVVR